MALDLNISCRTHHRNNPSSEYSDQKVPEIKRESSNENLIDSALPSSSLMRKMAAKYKKTVDQPNKPFFLQLIKIIGHQ